MWRRRIFWFLWILAIAGLYLFINNMGTRVVLVSSVLIPVIFMIFTALAAKGISVSIDLPQKARKGERIAGSLIIENKSVHPILHVQAVLSCSNLLTGEKIEKSEWFSIGRKSQQRIDIKLDLKHCGVNEVELKELIFYDVFGIAAWHMRHAEKKSCLIMPKGFPLQIEFNNEFSLLMESDKFSMVKPGNDPSETFAVREYVPGDPVKNIHWKLSEKIDRTMVRELGFPTENNVLVLLETSLPPNGEHVSAERIDALAEVFFSISQELTKREILHTVGWKDNETGRFLEFELSQREDLLHVIKKAMSNTFVADKMTVARCFANCHERCMYSHVAVISSYVEHDIDLLQNGNCLTLFLNEGDGGEMMRQEGIQILSFSESGYEDQLKFLEI